MRRMIFLLIYCSASLLAIGGQEKIVLLSLYDLDKERTVEEQGITDSYKEIFLTPSCVEHKSVQALESGIVSNLFLADGREYGVEITNDNGGKVIYLGLERILVNKGACLHKGQAIGWINSSATNRTTVIFLLLPPKYFASLEVTSENQIVLPLPLDSEVFSLMDGIVKSSGYDTENGIYLDIVNDDLCIRYKYLRSVIVKQQQALRQRQKIANSGITGLVDSPKLGIEFDDEDAKLLLILLGGQ